jgi:hypothetical protein
MELQRWKVVALQNSRGMLQVKTSRLLADSRKIDVVVKLHSGG